MIFTHRLRTTQAQTRRTREFINHLKLSICCLRYRRPADPPRREWVMPGHGVPSVIILSKKSERRVFVFVDDPGLRPSNPWFLAFQVCSFLPNSLFAIIRFSKPLQHPKCLRF